MENTIKSDQEIVDLANRYLKEHHPGGTNLQAQLDGIRHERNWWFVTVQPDREPPRTYEYYEALADAETDIEDNEGITIVFEPIPSVEDMRNSQTQDKGIDTAA